VNSYSRPGAGYWRRLRDLGIENRTTALRVIRAGPSSQRIEYRIAAADINPTSHSPLRSLGLGIEHSPRTGRPIDRER